MKIQNLLVALLAGLMFASNALAQVKLLEKVYRKGNEIIIPYEKYRLPNGLTLIIHEDHSDPIVYVDVTYHVGSNREELGRSGFAHFFEHMMFQGSENVDDEEHFRIVSEAGGTLNGTTNVDRTNYFQTLPSNQLEVALWLEADRMGFLLDAVTQQKFEIQRATVKNERGQNYDNRPYGLVNEKTIQALYPYGHPYSWPTIGYLDDLDAVNVEDLKRFFLRWYGPNNAVLTVAGDVDPKQVIALATKYFGSIPRGPEVKALPKMPAKLDGNRYISYEDNIRFPMLQMTWPTVHAHHPDELALDLVADILGSGKSSMLYQKLVKSGLCNQVYAMNPAQELAGSFVINAVQTQGASLTELERLIRETLDEFAKKGISNEQLQRFKNSTEAGLINRLQSVQFKGAQLASNETFYGNPNMIQKTLQDIQKLTAADGMRVFEKYIRNKPSVILSVVPKDKRDWIAAPDNYTPKISPPGAESAQYKNLKYVKAKDNFDRSIKPTPGPSPVVTIPSVSRKTMPNGLISAFTPYDELPLVSFILTLPGGHLADPLDKSGLASLTARMMSESTQNYSAETISDAIEALGSSISISAGEENIIISVSSLRKNLPQTMDLFFEKLLRPAFKEDEFELAKKQTLSAIANQATRANVIADNVNRKLIYGDGILSTALVGTKSSVENIQLSDVRQFYNTWIQAGGASLVVVGNIETADWHDMLEKFNALAAKPIPTQTVVQQKPVEKTKIYFVNKENAPQSEIRISFPFIPFDATGEFYKSQVMNFVLGGSFNSRINLNLREKRGFTYGARSVFSGEKSFGTFTAYAGVKADKTDSSVVEFLNEISLYRAEGITPKELAFTKSSLTQADALKYETPVQKAGFIRRMVEYDLPADYTRQQAAILQEITKNDIDGLARRNLRFENMNIVVVGDRNTCLQGLQGLGFEVMELNSEGFPMAQ